MKKIFTTLLLALFALSLNIQGNVNAQGNSGRTKLVFEPVSLNGTVIIDSIKKIERFFLDTKNNGTKEYELSFGPKEYTPSSGAVRPANGEKISLTGDLSSKTKIPLVIVYTLNELKWRDSISTRSVRNQFDPDSLRKNFSLWANRFGWSVKDSLVPVSVTGKAIVEPFSNRHKVYYMDELSDGTKDYILMFGPYWYLPKSGASKPLDGDLISIKGGMFQKDPSLPKIIVVQEINGLAWIDSLGKFPWPGQKIKRNAENMSVVKSVYDPKTYCQFSSNAMGNMFGHLFPSEIYASISEIDPIDLPVTVSDNIIASFSVNVTDNTMKGVFMPFDKNITFFLSYNDSELSAGKYEKRNLRVKYLGDDNELYNVPNAKFDYVNNTVSFSQTLLNGTYVIEAIEPETPANVEETAIPYKFNLEQNYPNPFNPETRISFDLPVKGNATLRIYDIIGSEIRTLINSELEKGSYHVTWNGKDNNGKNVSSGVYIYKLDFENSSLVKKMNLVR